MSRPLKDFLSYSQVVTNRQKFLSFILENIRLTHCSQRNSLKVNMALPLHKICVPCLCRGVGSRCAPRGTAASLCVKASVPPCLVKTPAVTSSASEAARGICDHSLSTSSA